jgi:hypothetical protein
VVKRWLALLALAILFAAQLACATPCKSEPVCTPKGLWPGGPTVTECVCYD